MATEYDLERRFNIFSEISCMGGMVLGIGIIAGGLTYNIITSPSTPPGLERYYHIGEKLQTPPSRNLEDFGSEERAGEQIDAYIDELRAERMEITSNPDLDFAVLRKTYESEMVKNRYRRFYSILGGLGAMVLGIIPSFFTRRKENGNDSEAPQTA